MKNVFLLLAALVLGSPPLLAVDDCPALAEDGPVLIIASSDDAPAVVLQVESVKPDITCEVISRIDFDYSPADLEPVLILRHPLAEHEYSKRWQKKHAKATKGKGKSPPDIATAVNDPDIIAKLAFIQSQFLV